MSGIVEMTARLRGVIAALPTPIDSGGAVDAPALRGLVDWLIDKGIDGVFAYALMEGLRGRAAVDAEGRVTALALGEWVMRRVPQLAREKGHQQNAVFRAAQRDLRSFPVAVVQR